MSQLKYQGGGGKPKTPASPTNTPDNLRSEDVVEFVLGLAEGPIKGLTNGDKSFYVGDTVLERLDGERNFEEFNLKVLPGDAEPETLTFKLGGEASNNQVGVALAQGVPVTRQTQTGNIDAIDIRLVVSSLYKSVQEGKNPGVFDHDFQFRIRYKPVSGSTWADWFDAPAQVPGTGNPYVNDYGDGWSNQSYYDSAAGEWKDPQNPTLRWRGSLFYSAIDYLHQQASSGGGSWNPPSGLYIRGKTTSAYVKEYRIPVQRIPEPYQIQIERITPDSSLGGDPQYIAEVQWESFQTVDKRPKKYPYTALVQGVARSTDQFTSIPQMSGEYDGLMVRIPSNYNPYTNVYTGVWDGTWVVDWTNNPVWILYEAIHNDRWGWATYGDVKWSKYEAYDLAKICSFILPNGKPRYTFNAYLTEPMDGREFCRYIAGSFNSVIVDDNNGNVRVLMDKDDPAVDLIGPESIIGDFEYTYTDTNTRANDVTVVFRNPEINYNEDRRRVHDDAHMAQFGRIPLDFVAVGCTDANEAVRKASRRIIAATTETEMVNFKINRRASNWAPYEILLITDPLKGYGHSARFKSFSGKVIQLREPIYLEAGVSYTLQITTPTGVVGRALAAGFATGWNSTLTLVDDVPANADQKAQFSLTDTVDYGLPKPYRILSLTRNDDDDWSVMAIEVNRNKFAAEDNAELVGEPQYNFIVKKEPAAPSNVAVRNVSRAAPDGTMIYEARVDFTPPNDPYVTEFYVRYRMQGQTEYVVEPVDGSGVTFTLPREGIWEFQVQSRNLWAQQSLWISPSPDGTNIAKSGAIIGGGITNVAGQFNQITVTVEYPTQTDIRYARIYAATSNNRNAATMVGRIDSTKFTHTGLNGVQTRWYWVAFEDNLGNVGAFPAGVSAGISGTTTQANGNDIANGSIGTEKFVPGFTGVENVSSLPTSGNYEGRMVLLSTDNKLYTYKNGAWVSVIPDISGAGIEKVDTLPTGLGMADQGKIVFLKSDNKIYRWTGTAWISQVSATDVTGFLQESNFPSNLRPQEVVTSLPGAPHIEGRLVYLTTDDKLYRNTGSGWTSATSTSDLTGTLGSNLFSNSLRPPEVVDSLPTSGNFVGKLVVLTTDSKLYRWNGSGWTKNIDTADLTGTISDTQLAGMSAAKLIGQLNDSQIANIAAAKIAGQLSDSQIANLSAAKIAGQLTSSQLQAIEAAKLLGTVSGTQIAASTITGANIAGGTIVGGNIAARTITGGNIVGATITGFEIVGDTITGAHIKGSTITGGNIVGGTITGGHIAANTITAGNLTAGIITAGYIASKAITVDKLAIGSTDNLITNGQFQSEAHYDAPLAWSRLSKPNAADTIRVVIDTNNTNPVKKALEMYRAVAGSGELSAWADNLAIDDPNYWEKGSLMAYPGDEFYVESQVFSSQANIARIEVLGKVASGAVIGGGGNFALEDFAFSSVNQNTVNINSAGWVKSVWTFRYTGAVPAKIGLRFWNLGSAAGQYVLYGNIIMRRRNTGTLLVDGAITANKISANTITGEKLVAATITGDKIAVNTIRTGNLLVQNFGANFVPDQFFEDIGQPTSFWSTVYSGAWYPEARGSGNVPAQMEVPRAIILWDGGYTGNETKYVHSDWKPIRATMGQVLRLRAKGFNLSNQSAHVTVQGLRVVTGEVNNIGAVNFNSQSGVTTQETQFAMGDGYTHWRVLAHNNGGSNFSGVLGLSDVQLDTAVDAKMVVDGSITAQKLVVGSITSAYIAANTITAKNLAIGSFDNVIPDGDYRDATFWGNGDGHVSVLDFNGAWTAARGIRFGPSGGTNYFDVYSRFFAIEPGATYKVTYRFYTGDMASGGWFQPLIHVPSYQWQSLLKSGPAGVNTPANSLGDIGNNDGSYYGAGLDTGEQSYLFTNPYGVGENANRQIQFRWIGNFTGSVYGQVKIVRVSDGTLIANNAITTGKIQAGTIVGGNIAANTITGGNIAANTITAGNISVANLAAINSNLGAITAGSLNINGRFVVDAAGNLTITSAASGARLVMTSSLIQVFDSNNVLRVRLGIW